MNHVIERNTRILSSATYGFVASFPSTNPLMKGRLLPEQLTEFLFDGKVTIVGTVAERINQRVCLWADSKAGSCPVEWAAVLTGPHRPRNNSDTNMITEFFELPTYNPDKQSHLTINMADIEKIDQEYQILAFAHSHPGGTLVPSLQDWITFTYIDFQVLRRSILYIILSPAGEKAIFSFKECHENMSCPLGMLKNVKGRWQS